jgi:hypothetical protein
MAVDHVKNLKKLRETLRKQRRKIVATMAGATKEPSKFSRLVELQQACDAVEWALEDEAAAATAARSFLDRAKLAAGTESRCRGIRMLAAVRQTAAASQAADGSASLSITW